MSRPIRLDGLLAKVEGTYGTDPTPTAGNDAVRVSERVFSTLTVSHAYENMREDVATGTLIGIKPGIPQGRMVEMDIAVELRGAGAAYSASVLPEVDALMRGCGWARTDDFTVSTENVEYSPADTGHEGVTIWGYAAGNVYKVNGCRGTMTWPIEAGQLGTLRFRMQGFMRTDPALAALPTFTYNATVAPAAVGMTYTIGAWAPDLVSAEFQQNADVQMNPSANATDGIAEFAIARHDPRIIVRAKKDPLATYDELADIKARTSRAITATLGSAQYARADLDVTNADVLPSPRYVDQNGFEGLEVEFSLRDVIVRFD